MGTPGHMAHPFDVDKVKTGQDLIDYINDAVLRLQNKEIAGSVKWDGINTSFKLILLILISSLLLTQLAVKCYELHFSIKTDIAGIGKILQHYRVQTKSIITLVQFLKVV